MSDHVSTNLKTNYFLTNKNTKLDAEWIQVRSKTENHVRCMIIISAHTLLS